MGRCRQGAAAAHHGRRNPRGQPGQGCGHPVGARPECGAARERAPVRPRWHQGAAKHQPRNRGQTRCQPGVDDRDGLPGYSGHSVPG
ncbi:hypothetical protein G6F45_014289 [Rhizopus arrhizus]|nr:hypothetical protein G6F45_014289 [Rhizopus arrhizus]